MYPESVQRRAVEFGRWQAKIALQGRSGNRGRKSDRAKIPAILARFEYDLRHEYCRLTPGLIRWCMAGFEEGLQRALADRVPVPESTRTVH